MIRIFIALVLMLVLAAFIGCNKSEEDVDRLEREALESETVEAVPDSSTIEAVVEIEEEPLTPEEELANRRYEGSGSGGFTIQVGSGTTRLNANYAAEQYISRGYEAFVSEVYIDDVSYFRIRVGNFETFEEAKLMGDDLKDKYSVDYWIDNNI
ncbi:MAG: SPOR domain-containing protein [candidate division Zixibacteria bacterium]|nr:SPOR domain-containing protein [candidate division Zixibacteria bacterium]